MATLSGSKHVLVQLNNENGVLLGGSFDVPIDITVDNLQLICNALLQQVCSVVESNYNNCT